MATKVWKACWNQNASNPKIWHGCFCNILLRPRKSLSPPKHPESRQEGVVVEQQDHDEQRRTPWHRVGDMQGVFWMFWTFGTKYTMPQLIVEHVNVYPGVE